MIRPHITGASPIENSGILRLATVALAALAWGCAALPASANVVRIPDAPMRPTLLTDHDHHGNGRHNRNTISVRSPTHNRGYQHTNNSNAGGTNPVQNAVCRNVTVCHVSQKIVIVEPERPGQPVSPPSETPAPSPPPAIAPVGSGTVASQSAAVVTPLGAVAAPRVSEAPRVREAPRVTEAPRPATAPAQLSGPFMYVSPDGFMMMASDAKTPFAFGPAAEPAVPFPMNMFF